MRRRIIEYRLKEKERAKVERRVLIGDNPKILGLKPNKKYQLKESRDGWAQAQECKANDNGQISLSFYNLGFTCR